jgi:chromosome segregation ATPase
MRKRIDELTARNAELERKTANSPSAAASSNPLVNPEVERLRAMLADREREADSLRYKASSLEQHLIDLQTKAQAMEGQMMQLSAENDRLNRSLSGHHDEQLVLQERRMNDTENRKKFDAERTALEAQIIQMKQWNVDNENRIKFLILDNEKLNALLMERTGDNERLRSRIVDLERGKFEELEMLRGQLDAYKKNNLDARELSVKFGVEKNHLEAQVELLRQSLEVARMEASKQNELLSITKHENDKLREESDKMRRELYTASNERSLLANDATQKSERLDHLQKDFDVVKVSRDGYQQEIEKNSSELMRKNQELALKLQEIDQLQKRFEEAIKSASQMSPKRSSTTSSMVMPTFSAFPNAPSQAVSASPAPNIPMSSSLAQIPSVTRRSAQYGSPSQNPMPQSFGGSNAWNKSTIP